MEEDSYINPTNPDNERQVYFHMKPKNQSKLYLFKNKQVHALFNIMLNYVAAHIETQMN